MAALDGQCGLCEVQSERMAFPLKMRYAQQWVSGKVVLMGDAAHTIHPLAGLGMNLGLKDAAYLIELLSNEQGEFASARTLRDYERTRKLDAQKHIAMMQGLKELFAGANPLKKLVRGVGLSLVDNLGPIKHLFAKEAIGK
jgi:2-octaprenylphenol hydroxylase